MSAPAQTTDQSARERILDYYHRPRNQGALFSPSLAHEEKSSTCGDFVRMELDVEGERVRAARFSGEGCSISLAAASMLTEMVEGRSLQEVRGLSKNDILEALAVPLGPSRLPCALLGLKILRVACFGPGSEEDDEEDW